jgi:hypothetical protein
MRDGIAELLFGGFLLLVALTRLMESIVPWTTSSRVLLSTVALILITAGAVRLFRTIRQTSHL